MAVAVARHRTLRLRKWADGSDYGGSGAGGGASLNGFASGAGGKGGKGYARVRFVYNPMAAPVDTVESYVDLGNKTGAVTVDYRAGRWQKMTLTGNVTLTISNLPAGPIVGNMFLMLTQDATGGLDGDAPGWNQVATGRAAVLVRCS